MAKGTLNKVMLIGRLGGDPEIRTTASGAAVANFSLATNHNYKDNQTGEWREGTEWHRVTLFSRAAEVARDYLRKGSLAYVEGRIQTRKWQDQNGMDRYTTEIIGDRMEMIGGRNDNAGGYPQPPAQQNTYTPPAQNTGYTPPPQNTAAQPTYTPPTPNPTPTAPPVPAPPPVDKPSSGAPDNLDDDIPF